MLRKIIIALLGCTCAASAFAATSIQVNVKNNSGYDVYCSYTYQGDTTVTYNPQYSECHLQNGQDAVPYITYTSQSGNPQGTLNLNIENPTTSSSGGSAFCTVNINSAEATVSNNSGAICDVTVQDGAYNVTVSLNSTSSK